MGWWWDGGGMVVEWWWNGGGMVVGWWWDGGGMVVEWWWDSGLKTKFFFSQEPLQQRPAEGLFHGNHPQAKRKNIH